MSKPDLRDVMRLKKCKNAQELMKVCELIYLQGVADATDGTVDSKDRFLHLKKGVEYEMVCPECGKTIGVDLEGMLEDQEEGEV